MRNLIDFIWRHNFFFYFLLLEAVSLFMLLQNNNYQKAAYVNSSNKIATTVYSSKKNVAEYLELKKVNDELAKENARLRTNNEKSFEKMYERVYVMKDTVYKQQYQYISAKVINNSTNKRNNYITINRGAYHGVKPEMGIIGPDGVVGIVKDVSDNFASVLSILHKNIRLSARIKKNNYFGSLYWDGNDKLFGTLTDIPKHVEINKGDTIVTSAYSSIFPENVVIGTVEDKEIKDDSFYIIKVRFSTNFSNLNYVYVVNYLYKTERKNLETRSQDDK
jgi:rod shape-determining protein MreC